MADFIGIVEVPEVAPEGVFPLTTMYGYGYERAPDIVTHSFLSANAKIEQRYYRGDGLRRHHVRLPELTHQEFQALRDFWEARHGPYQPFTYDVPAADGENFTSVTARFENTPLTLEHLTSVLVSTGLTLVEVPDPADAPVHAVSSTATRFPSSSLQLALTDPVQRVIPLVKIAVREPGYPSIFISDRRVTVGGDLYLPRLLGWSGISQGINGESDEAVFTLGNADRVMRDVSNSTDLKFARLEFSIFHVSTGVKLDLWVGRILNCEYDAGPEFTIRASDFLYELSLAYPPRVISHQCWKNFNHSPECPYDGNGTPGFGTCPRSWPDCEARGMTPWFGGINLEPQGLLAKKTSTGFQDALRRMLSPLSLVNDGASGMALQEIYTDIDMPVNCIMMSGREERDPFSDKPMPDFYDGLGIVGAGPLATFAQNGLKHRLDGQAPHGPLPLGLRRSEGHDPVQNNRPDPDSDKFGLGQVSPSNPNTSVYPGATKAAGVAFLEIRRPDEKGMQLTQITEHQMQAWISGGLRGWAWTMPGDRFEATPNVNPVWVAVNMILRALGLHTASAEEQEAVIDIPSCVAAADICNNEANRADAVPGLTGTETQFKFRGVVADVRTLRDWLNDVLNCCCGYYVQSSGKVKFGIRVNSSALAAFTDGNVILDSVKISQRSPQFNSLTVTFGDADYEWQPRAYTIDSFEHARMVGSAYPQKLKADMNLVGVSTIAQAGRIAITRLREELGGITPVEWRTASTVALKTTILGLDVEVGMVVSLTHDDAPGGYHEFRVHRWTLNDDWSVTLEGQSTKDSMYDLVVGPKPADVTPSPVPVERHWQTLPPQPWFPFEEQPAEDDPILNRSDWTFGLQQTYETAADGTALAKLVITGQYPITQVLPALPPRIGVYATSTTGGVIPGGQWVVFAITALDAVGRETRASEIIAIPVDVGTNTNSIVLSNITWPLETVGYRLYAGTNHAILSRQFENIDNQPETITVTAYPNYRTLGLPRPDLDTLRVRIKICEHAGVIGQAISAVGTGTIQIVAAGWTPDQWTGRIASVITDLSDGSAQLWNFLIASNTEDTLTVAPDPLVAGIEVFDVLTIRTKATGFSSTTISDEYFINSLFPNGATPGEEVGRTVRIIHGAGAGQERRITANDWTTLTVDSPWIVTPDATSIFVVERSAWEYAGAAGRLADEVIDGRITFSVPVDNFAGRTVTVEVAPVTRDGREPAREYNVRREIYIYGDEGELARDILATY